MKCVWGLPWSNSKGGPEPPRRSRIGPSLTVTRSRVKPGKSMRVPPLMLSRVSTYTFRPQPGSSMSPPPTSLHLARLKARPPYAAPGQAIGLLGGSFDPPHIAHRLISEAALKRARLDKVWWLVSPGNPLKRRNPPAPLAERLRLCRSVAANRHIVVTGFEADLPTAYTVSTLSFLRSRSPLVHFVWIMGADSLANFHRWARWREIFTMVP